MGHLQSVPDKVIVRIVASAQFSAQGDANYWMSDNLSRGILHDHVETFRVLDVTKGELGIQYVTFTVDLNLDSNMSYGSAKEWSEHVLTGIVGDPVEIHWVGHP